MEFENLQIEVPKNDESSPLYGVKVYEKKYKNKKDFVVGFNPNEQEFKERKNRRAKRFGLKEPATKIGTEEQPLNVDEEAAVTPIIDKEKREPKTLDLNFFKNLDLSTLDWPAVPDSALEEMRLDAIHVFGVEHMSTKDIFDYFTLFGPDTLEWIDDYSCNVVWDDEDSVVRAMDTMSKSYNTLKKLKNMTEPKFHIRSESPDGTDMNNVPENIKVEEGGGVDGNTQSDAVLIDDDDIDPKDVWRVGYLFKTYQLFLRPATVSDKKMPGAASRSRYYLLYGKRGNGKVPGIVSKSRKRKLEEMKKRANEIFKTKDPDVKIVPLEELRTVNKMEVDDDEPVVKRINLNVEEQNTMSMVADRVEVAKRLGNRYDDVGDHETTVYDRLGRVNRMTDDSDEENDDASYRVNEPSTNIRDRLGGSEKRIHGRLGNRETPRTDTEGDARKDIERLRKKQDGDGNNFRSGYRELGYEDENEGVYHDIWRADDIKTNSSKKDDRNSRQRTSRRDNVTSLSRKRELSKNNGVKNRLGKSSPPVVADDSSPPSSDDLRGRLKRGGDTGRDRRGEGRKDTRSNKSSGKTIKEEVEIRKEDRLNLCIEIKQEERDPLEDIDIEMNDVGDFEF